jgi:hypothetical protein
LVDEALGLKVVVETTRDALPADREHLAGLGVPLLTVGTRGLVEKGDSFVPPLNQMFDRRGQSCRRSSRHRNPKRRGC